MRQYCYFAIHSVVMSPEEIAKAVGLEPNSSWVRAWRSVDPPRPVSNKWRIDATTTNATVDDQLASILGRLAGHEDAISALVRRLADDPQEAEYGGATMQVVRHFNDDEGVEELGVIGPDLRKLAGQHQLLGWHLDLSTLQLLQRLGASLDVDEYG
jgi:Domain of unknown function (DUF4279)